MVGDAVFPPEGYAPNDWERFHPEPPKESTRTPFERDRARIVHSSGLRRLGAKTQVLGAGTGDFVRTRLTHTLEVAQIGRGLAKVFGCDQDVVDAACLAHDLGHPPFGHHGERVLNEVAAPCGGFEGNAQTLRLLTRLEPKILAADGTPYGLNLTRASLDAAVKYPWLRGDAPAAYGGSASPKFGAYPEDLAVFDWLRQGAPTQELSFEAQVMDVADDIAYSVHDVEDAVVYHQISLRVLTDRAVAAAVFASTQQWYPQANPEELAAALARLSKLPWWVDEFDGSLRALASLKDMTSQLIGRLCGQIIEATRAASGAGALTRHRANLVVPRAVEQEILLLKGIAVHFLMIPRGAQPFYRKQATVIRELVEALYTAGARALEPTFAVDFEAATSDSGRLRVVVDQVASLTDKSALDWYNLHVHVRRRARTNAPKANRGNANGTQP